MVCLHLVDLLPGQSGAEIVVKSTQFVHIYGYIHRSVNSIFEVAFSKFWSRPILYHVDTDDSPTDVDKRTVHTKCASRHHHHHHHHQSLNREGRWGTTDDFATSFLHFSLFSTALWDLPISRLVHSLMLSSHLFLCLPCLLPPFTVPCKTVLARHDERETWPYHCSLRLFTIVRRSPCGPIACWILARTSLLVAWSLYEMCSILR